MLRAPKFDPAADLAANFIEHIELDALALRIDTRTLGVMIAKHLAMWFEAWPHQVPSRREASARHRRLQRDKRRSAGTAAAQ